MVACLLYVQRYINYPIKLPVRQDSTVVAINVHSRHASYVIVLKMKGICAIMLQEKKKRNVLAMHDFVNCLTVNFVGFCQGYSNFQTTDEWGCVTDCP